MQISDGGASQTISCTQLKTMYNHMPQGLTAKGKTDTIASKIVFSKFSEEFMTIKLDSFQNAIDAAKQILNQKDLLKTLESDPTLSAKMAEVGMELSALSAEVAFVSAEGGGGGGVLG